MIPLVLAAAMMQETGLKSFERGSFLYHACKGAVRWIDAAEDQKPNNEDENFANCTSYMQGFTDGLPNKTVCFHSVTTETMIRVYIAYMDRHPKLMEESRAYGLLLALTDSYPCHTK